jgi:hypothetical protein
LVAADPYDLAFVARQAQGGALWRAHRVLQAELELLLREHRVGGWVREDTEWARRAEARGATFAQPDLTLPDPAWGTHWVVDVTVADAQGTSGSADHPGRAAAAAQQRKARHYASALAATTGAVLAPVAVETFGGLGDGARSFLRRLAELCRGDDALGLAPRLAHHFAQRLGVAVLREQVHTLRRYVGAHAAVAQSADWQDSTGDLQRDCRAASVAAARSWCGMSASDLSGVSLEFAAFA